MKQHTPTRREKENLTDMFLRGKKKESLPESYKAWPESAIKECWDRSENRKRVESEVHGKRFAAPKQIRITSAAAVPASIEEDSCCGAYCEEPCEG